LLSFQPTGMPTTKLLDFKEIKKWLYMPML